MILVSDGIIQDYETCRPLLDWAVDRGIVISVIGVADEFDEEFLMTVADLTRGNYYYAATAPEVEQAVRAELEVITKVVGRQGSLRVFPESGCIIQDVYPVSPALSEFQAVWVENGGWRFRIGDISAAQDPEFLVALAPGSLAVGEARLGTIRVEGSGAVTAGYFYSDTPMPVLVTDDARLIQARDDEVMDSVRKLEVYRLERRAAEAAGRGDQDASTRALRAATRALNAMGREDLATEMDAAADASETGTRNLSLTKRVKAGTRRLGSR
jgi:Ca-activated chloride channel family protein